MQNPDEQNDTPADLDPPIPVPEITDVKLPLSEANKITEFINGKAVVPNDACPVCGSPNNLVNEYVWKVETQKVGPTLGGRFQPLVSTTCNNCGYVRFFNKIIMDWAMQQADAVEGEVQNGD